MQAELCAGRVGDVVRHEVAPRGAADLVAARQGSAAGGGALGCGVSDAFRALAELAVQLVRNLLGRGIERTREPVGALQVGFEGQGESPHASVQLGAEVAASLLLGLFLGLLVEVRAQLSEDVWRGIEERVRGDARLCGDNRY